MTTDAEELRCLACGYFLAELRTERGLIRLRCPNRQCRKQSWFIVEGGRATYSGLGDHTQAIGMFEKLAELK